MTYTLLIDLGSTGFKTALYCQRTPSIKQVRSQAAVLPNSHIREGRHELDPELLIQQVEAELQSRTEELGSSLQSLILSTQMHGIILTDESNQPISPYLSWQDERSLEQFTFHGRTQSGLEHFEDVIPERIRRKSGLPLRPGIGAVNLALWLQEQNSPPRGGRIHTLGSFIFSRLFGVYATHLTNGAALGLVDLTEGKWSEDIVRGYGLDAFALPEILGGIESISVTHQKTFQKYQLFPDIGDHQAALHGGNDLAPGEAAISLGTAGIAAVVSEKLPDENSVEVRPFLHNKYLFVESRLPGGRTAEMFYRFLSSAVATLQGDILEPGQFWERVSDIAETSLSQQKKLSPTLSGDSRRFGRFSYSITGLSENTASFPDLAVSFLKYYVASYRQALKNLEEASGLPITGAVLNGGMAEKNPWFRSGFLKELKVTQRPVPGGELSLKGLAKIVQQYLGSPDDDGAIQILNGAARESADPSGSNTEEGK